MNKIFIMKKIIISGDPHTCILPLAKALAVAYSCGYNLVADVHDLSQHVSFTVLACAFDYEPSVGDGVYSIYLRDKDKDPSPIPKGYSLVTIDDKIQHLVDIVLAHCTVAQASAS